MQQQNELGSIVNSQTNEKIEKIRLLRKELNQSDFKLEDLINIEQLQNMLDKRIGRVFARDVLSQFVSRMQKNHQGNFTLNEFIDVLIEADQILNDKIQFTKNELNNLKMLRKQTSKQMEEDRRLEHLNEYDISDDSRLTINILEANIIAENILNYNQFNYETQIQIQVCNQNESTNVLQGIRPVFNQKFIFQIITGQEQIMIKLVNIMKNNIIIGQKLIEINQFQEQNIEQLQVQLENSNKQNTASVNLQIQWIHSKVKAYQKHLNILDMQIQELDDDLVEYNRDLDTITEPFKSLKSQINLSKQKYYNNLGNSQYFDKNNIEKESNLSSIYFSILTIKGLKMREIVRNTKLINSLYYILSLFFQLSLLGVAILMYLKIQYYYFIVIIHQLLSLFMMIIFHLLLFLLYIFLFI